MSYYEQHEHLLNFLMQIDMLAIKKSDHDTMRNVAGARMALREMDMAFSRIKDTLRIERLEREEK